MYNYKNKDKDNNILSILGESSHSRRVQLYQIRRSIAEATLRLNKLMNIHNNAEIVELSNMINQEAKKYEANKKANDEFKKVEDILVSEVQKIGKEVDDLKIEYEELKKLHNSQQIESKKLQNKIKVLKKRYSDMEKQKEDLSSTILKEEEKMKTKEAENESTRRKIEDIELSIMIEDKCLKEKQDELEKLQLDHIRLEQEQKRLLGLALDGTHRLNSKTKIKSQIESDIQFLLSKNINKDNFEGHINKVSDRKYDGSSSGHLYNKKQAQLPTLNFSTRRVNSLKKK
ncbi:uncharacterized protein CMU_036760 [Cryptosporidium muris RN66]|uniref:Uncharacterized protein n=1 Tax=Cryptosporidium muris (strain RN66) TaxID=441375 RepID=B6AH11_CRYMR|nr:uncharacterized protein CMU_036760 [Cryptosporidium muris RN66]EEA07502.1 hypothetical protein CMU_036760 [Cryptosporidium muris RN66]|eukprot:XP_002141851.1 hypothetical protein [Cryptosporidium muris RN66]